MIFPVNDRLHLPPAAADHETTAPARPKDTQPAGWMPQSQGLCALDG